MMGIRYGGVLWESGFKVGLGVQMNDRDMGPIKIWEIRWKYASKTNPRVERSCERLRGRNERIYEPRRPGLMS